MKKLLIFDLGDTLEPTHKFQNEGLEKLVLKYNLPQNFKEVYKWARRKIDKRIAQDQSLRYQRRLEQVFGIVIKSLRLDFEPYLLAKDFRDIYWQEVKAFYEHDPLGKETLEVIGYLKNLGFKNVILSNNTLRAKERFLKILKAISKLPVFDSIIVSEEVGAEKPSKKIFWYVIEKFQIQPNEAVMIGNSMTQDGKSSEYEIQFILVYGYTLISNLQEYRGEKIEFINWKNLRPLLDFIKSK